MAASKAFRLTSQSNNALKCALICLIITYSMTDKVSFLFKLVLNTCVPDVFLVSIFIPGLIELRGGAPLLDMLPDMFEWPIAVDNWENNYGGVLFSTHSHIQ